MILNLLIGLLTDNWQWIVGAIGAVAVAIRLRKSGENAVRAKLAKRKADTLNEVIERKSDAAKSSDADLADRLSHRR